MNDFFKVILSMSLSGSLLIVCFLLLKPLIKKHVSKPCFYYVWLIVIARLIVPLSPEVSLVGTLFNQIDNQSLSAISQEKFEPNYISSNDNNAPTDNAESPTPPISVPESKANHVKNIIINNLWIVWLAGAFFILIRKITVYQSFVSYIKASRVPVDDINVLDNFSIILEQCKIKQHVSLYSNSLISSPILIGFFKPCIILPTIQLSDTDFQNTILHELAHCKRLDMFYKWLVQITLCIHWFNPLVYLMRREINLACELSCDSAVLKQIDGRYIEYGDTLVNAITLNGSYKEACASVTLNENKEQLKERLEAIMQFKSKPKFAIFVAVLLIIGACLGATFVGAYNAPISQSDPVNPNGLSNSSNSNSNNQNSISNVNKTAYGYMSSRYYAKPYIVELMFYSTIKGNPLPNFTVNTNIILADGQSCTISYKPSVEAYASKSDFLDSLQILLDKLSQDKVRNLSLNQVVISAVDGPYTESEDKLTQKFYSDDNIANFSAVYNYASQATIKEYQKKAYDDNRIDFFSILSDTLTVAERKTYADKAYKDDRIDFFSILSDNLTVAERTSYADKAYKDDRIDFFSILSDNLSATEKKAFADKAYADDKIHFFSILSDNLTTEELKSFADKAYKDDRINFFSILSDNLILANKKAFANDAYKDDKINFFSILSDDLIASDKATFATKAYTDNKINFFSLLSDELTSPMRSEFAEKAYKDNKINFFSILSRELSSDQRKSIATKAYKDNNVNFFNSIFSDLSATDKKNFASLAYKDKKTDLFYSLAYDLSNIDKKEFAQKAYSDNNIDIFKGLSNELSATELNSLINKAYSDNKVDFFRIMAYRLDTSTAKALAEQAYKDNKLEMFAALTNKLDSSTIKSFTTKATKDKKEGFKEILTYNTETFINEMVVEKN